ncbi:hypothetical protein RYX36_029383, partial [Vicia faba]
DLFGEIDKGVQSDLKLLPFVVTEGADAYLLIPAPPPPKDLFITLNKHIQASVFTNAVKLIDQILIIAPGDEDALRCKVVTLIKDDRFDDVVSAIPSSKTLLEDFHFLKAFYLYKHNKLDEALPSLQKHERNDETMFLESQIL